jgi:anti-sigma regulatory factor (Ser/Thr protein kinase)
VLERHAETWADAALLLAAPSAALCRELTRLGLRPPIYPSRAAALTAAALTPVPARVRLPFGVDVTAPAAARHAARAACGRWNLSSSLAQRATQVVTELVTNTVQHARTEGTLLLWRRQAFLHLSVRDGSRSPPVLYEPAAPAESGYGLRLVDALSSGWGVRMVPDGKVVWATLRTWSHVE